MTLQSFLQQTNLDNSVLIGYYGGGNYGDELLLEVLGNLLTKHGARQVAVLYQQPENYPAMHHDFGFKLVNIHNRLAVLGAAFRAKNIIIGGGGLWGLDMNLNTFVLSLFLFVSRWILRKRVYLLGVGFYNSAPRAGRLAAWFAAKAANHIIARDSESLENFQRISKHVSFDKDIAWQTQTLDLKSYQREAKHLQNNVPIGDKTLLIALRRSHLANRRGEFTRLNKLIRKLVASNPNLPIVLIMSELDSKDTSLHDEAKNWRRHHKHLRIIEAPYNPLALLTYIKQNRKRLALIAPQLHMIMTAHLAGVPFLPIVYDNKVSELFDQIGIPPEKRLHVSAISSNDLTAFVEKLYGGKK